MTRAARVAAAWVSGVDGLDGSAAGTTILRLSSRPYDQQNGALGMDLTLAAGQSLTHAAGEVAIPSGGWLYIFIMQATGGHYSAQVGFEISWQE